MPHDSFGRFVRSPRALISGVSLLEGAMLSATTRTALKALPPDLRFEGALAIVQSDRSRWTWVPDSTLTDTTENVVLTPSVGTGRWVRVDRRLQLKLAIGFGTPDAAALFTAPTGFRYALLRLWWEITTGFTGGVDSAIGVSGSAAPHNTKGDFLGGAGGDLAATLVAGAAIGGTIGADFGSNGQPVLEAGVSIRFDRIASVFTAGAGFVHCLADRIE